MSLPLSQGPATSSYPKPDQFGLCLHFLKIHFNIISPSIPRSSNWSLFFLTFPRQNPVSTFLSPEHVTCSACFSELFRNIVIFKGGESLAPRPSPKLEDHPFSAVRDGLFSIFAGLLPIWKPFLQVEPVDMPCCGDRR